MRWVALLAALSCLLLGSCSGSHEAGKPVVTVYMYSEYVYPELPKEFEQRTGMSCNIDVYEATEEMLAKLQQAGGTSQYDVVVMSDHAISVAAKLGLIQPLDKARIPNAVHVSDQFKSPPFDPEQKYSLPYQWGTVGLMYNKEQLPNLAPTWDVIFQETGQTGTFVLMDSMRDMLGIALKYKGFSANSRKPEELRLAGEGVLAAKKSPRSLGFEGGVGGKNRVVAGTAAMAIVYNGDAVRAIGENDKLAFLLPREGAIIWVDCMTVPSQAPNLEGAHKFFDFILDPDVGAKLSNFNRYATPNTASLPAIAEQDRNNRAIYPSEQDLSKLEYLQDLGNDTRLYDEVWTAVKSR